MLLRIRLDEIIMGVGVEPRAELWGSHIKRLGRGGSYGGDRSCDEGGREKAG